MELRVLRYFLAVARERSMTRAAVALHITQPTLSRQIMELEEELGTRLFERDKKPMRLTEAGMRFCQRAEEIVSLSERTVKEFAARQSDISGEIVLGCAESRGIGVIAEVMRRIHRHHPRIRLVMQTANATLITEQLEHGVIDFGFILAPADISRFDHLRLPHTDTWGVLLRRDHPLANSSDVTPQQVAALPLIIPSRPPVASFLSGWLRRDINDCDIIGRFNLSYNASKFVEAGLGCSITLGGLTDTSASSPFCFIPFRPALLSPCYLVWKKARLFSRAAQVFYLFLQRYVQQASEASASAPAIPPAGSADVGKETENSASIDPPES
ncbi:MAG TPA: LysR family transcriptional regulator [Candidatus Akkermansia intestinavium]|nr:LysR family transcriptional regulator [Candidatus Akkermansia intestinavium]